MAIPRRRNPGTAKPTCLPLLPLPLLLLLLMTRPTRTAPAGSDNPRPNIFATRSIDLHQCYLNLLTAANYDQFLTQSEFIAFVQLSSNHQVGHVNEWGMNITTFSMLDPRLVGVYNLHACGDALVGCPGIEGIDIGVGGDKLQMESGGSGGLLNQICNETYSVIEEILGGDSAGGGEVVVVPTGEPTVGPTAVVNGTNGVGGDDFNMTLRPSASPSVSPSVSSSMTNSTPGITNACPPIYVPNTPYEASSQVINPNDNSTGSNTKVYACKEAPYTPWCSQVGYEPGVALAWDQAWTVVGECDANVSVDGAGGGGGNDDGIVTTVPSTVTAVSTTTTVASTIVNNTVMPGAVTPSPTPMVVGTSKVPTVENSDDPLYTGTLTIPFQYEIGNDAYLSAQAIETGTNPVNDMLNVLLESTSTLVEEVVVDTFGQTRRGLRSNGGQVRILQVVYSPDTVTIEKLENIYCPTSLPPEALCQTVSCQVDLILTDEPKMSTELRFRNNLYKAIDNGAMSFPEDSNIVYTQSPRSSVSVLPENNAQQPEEGDTESSDGSNKNSWVLPVSITCASVGVLLLSLLLGFHVVRGRHKAEAAMIQQSLEGDDLDDDIKGSGREDYMGQEKNYYQHDVEKGNVMGSSRPMTKQEKQSSNPFIESSSSSFSSSSSSSSYSSSSRSSMSESDVSSSTEDLDERKQNRAEVDTSNLEPYRLPTLAETSNEDLATSGVSLQSTQSMYRAGIEALLKEACPEELENLDNIMKEYEGREEQLIGQLSSMLAAMNRNTVLSDDEKSGGSGENKTLRGSAMSSVTSNTSSTSDYGDLSSRNEADQSQFQGAHPKKESPTEQDKTESENTAAAAAAATLFNSESLSTGVIDHYSSSDDSSSAGSSDWSTDEGLSSVDASMGTEGSVVNTTPSMLAAIGVASSITKQVGLNELASLSSESDEKQTATRRDLNEAIEGTCLVGTALNSRMCVLCIS
eukprot:CCRYP_007922-RB/>CCRYP_007922-RB protein AED:0.01 eAED:0.01 QI:367/1/1/1/1/1/3/1064/971